MLKVEYVPIDEIEAYPGNAKIHTGEQIEQIKKSIQEFGFNDPLGIWHGEIVEGHGRLIAAKELGYTEIPVIKLDDLTDEQRRAYALVHNQTTMNTGFDIELLSMELDGIESFDMSVYGFETLTEGVLPEEKYIEKTDIPQYEPSDEHWEINDLYDDRKTQKLIEGIKESEIADDIKNFLILAAHRHTKFSYKKIADYYASAPQDVQRLMENSALVIIDFDNAIKNGYTTLDRLAGEYTDDET